MSIKVGFYKINDKTKLPIRAHEGDACYDVFSTVDMNISPRETKLFPLGFKVAIPEGWELLIRPRSGLSLKSGLTVLNSPGVIDSGYRGEVGVILYNAGESYIWIPEGTKIAQLSLKRVYEIDFVEVETEVLLGETTRGENSFGSTDGD